MAFTIFSHTSAILSSEVITKCGDFPWDPDSHLHKICLDNDIRTSFTEQKQCLMEGNWTAIIEVYNSIARYLQTNFNTNPGILTIQDFEHGDNRIQVQDMQLVSLPQDENQTTPDHGTADKKQTRMKVPDPIVYSFITSDTLINTHPVIETIADTVTEYIKQHTSEPKQDHSQVINFPDIKEETHESRTSSPISQQRETNTGKKTDRSFIRVRRRKSLTPKKSTKSSPTKRQINKKSITENKQDKNIAKRPSSLKPKKSWSQKLLQDEFSGTNLEDQVNMRIDIKHVKDNEVLVENDTHDNQLTSEVESEKEIKKDSEIEWNPEQKGDLFQVKGTKALKLTLKKQQKPKSLKKRRRNKNDETEPIKQEFTCSQCSYVSSKRANLREHVQRMHKDKIWSCEFCDKIFSIQKDLVRHEKCHLNPQLCCDFCGKMYKSRRTFIQHKKSHEENYIKPEYECKVCKKSFSTKYVLNYHVKSEHLGMKKQFLCPTCGKSFTQKNSYVQHANVHMGLKPYQCEHCGKSFAYEKSLKEHRFMHDEVLHFKCDICDKLFRQKSALQIHKKIHKVTKDHLCGTCGKGFTQRQALLRHERIHNGDKPFSCAICSRTFSDASIIRRHMILVHKKHTKEWREDVICDLKGAEDYWIEGKKPEGRIKRLPPAKKTDNNTEVQGPQGNNNQISQVSADDTINNFVDEFSLHQQSTEEQSRLHSDAVDQSSPDGRFIQQSLYSVSEEQMKETAIYLRKNPTMLQTAADTSENDMLLNSNISQYLHNPQDSNHSVNLDHTFNEPFTSLHERKSEERLTHPFHTNVQMRNSNQWTAEPFPYNTVHYMSHYQNYQN